MRRILALIFVALGFAAAASGQTCTGLCLQQMACPGGATTSITGVVYAPNGIDPLPNVQVYIPNAPVDAFTPGVSCPLVGQPPSGSPLVGTVTAVDGTFTIDNAPVGVNIPLVIVSGRWRRQLVIPSVGACVNTTFPAVMPRDQTEGDIPRFAISTGAVDAVECVLRKVGISDKEFTDPGGTGRINFYLGAGSPGAAIDSATPSETTLLSDSAALNSYDVLMLPCQGAPFPDLKTPAEYANFVAFANAGGRVYSSHYSYQWMFENPPFDTVVKWAPGQAPPPNGIATVNAGFSGGQELSEWLQLVGASTTPGQIAINTLRHDFNGVNPPTESWLVLNNPSYGNPVMQFVFDAPLPSGGVKPNQCGRVLYNEYHVEAASTNPGFKFPTECLAGAMTPQEKLLEYSLFELTNDGGSATLTPATQDFGTAAVGFDSAAQTFTWTNHSTFGAAVTLLTASTDFIVASSNCKAVAPNSSCSINVLFHPTAIGPRTGVLTVGSNGQTLTAALTGNAIPALTLAFSAIDFGSIDVGAHTSRYVTVTNGASGPVPVPGFTVTGDYAASSNCGSSIAAGASCNLALTFTPTVFGPRPGTVAVSGNNTAPPANLTGNGLDFSMTMTPASGTVIAGYSTSTSTSLTPLAGFAANVVLSCTTDAPGSVCTPVQATLGPGAGTSKVNITTTSQYTVIGYTGGLATLGWPVALCFGSGLLLALRRRRIPAMLRAGLVTAVVASATLGLGGCSGKLPGLNPNYTVPGTYTYTVSATDGFLVHTTTYSLNVTKN